MKTSKFVLLVSFVLGLAAVPAFGASFDFAYLFGNGDSVTGSLEGTLTGQYVDNVSNVSLSFNGTAFAGTIYAGQYLDGVAFPAGPIVSFVASQNNFVFADTDIVGGDAGFSSLFAIFYDTASVDYTAVGFSPLGTAGQDLPLVSANWSLTQTSDVPEGGATVALLGLALAGVAMRIGIERKGAVRS